LRFHHAYRIPKFQVAPKRARLATQINIAEDVLKQTFALALVQGGEFEWRSTLLLTDKTRLPHNLAQLKQLLVDLSTHFPNFSFAVPGAKKRFFITQHKITGGER